MNCFWAAKNTIIVGSATMMAPAAMRLLSTKKLPLRLLSAEVIGISSDSTASHEAFGKKHGLPMTLLSDPKGFARKSFGVGSTLGKLFNRIEAHGVNPRAIQVMAEIGIDLSGHTSNLVDQYLNTGVTHVIYNRRKK